MANKSIDDRQLPADFGLNGKPRKPGPIQLPADFGWPNPGGGGKHGALAPAASPAGAAASAATLQDIFAPAQQAAPVQQPYQGQAQGQAQAQGQGGGGGGGGGGNINNWIRQLMDRFLNDGGMGDELRMDLRNQATQTGKVRERDRILRRADDFAARGLFGSGLSNRAVQGIEAEESVALQGSLNEIEFQNAQMEAQSLRDAIGALNAQIQWKLGRGMLNVQREQMALAKLQHAEQMALAWAKFNWDKLRDQAPGDFGDQGPGGFNPNDIPPWFMDQFVGPGGPGGPGGDLQF